MIVLKKISLLYFSNSFKKFDLVSPVKKRIDKSQLSLELNPKDVFAVPCDHFELAATPPRKNNKDIKNLRCR